MATERMKARMSSTQLRRAVRDGKSVTIFDTETALLRGASIHSVIHDEVIYEAAPKHERGIDYSQDLDPTELRWAAAYRKVYNVGAGFFERQSKKERDARRKCTTELAEKGRGVPAQKAAEVLAAVTEYALEGRVPSGGIPKSVMEFKTSPTGRQVDHQLDVYRYLFQQLPRSKT